jgi:replication factor C subunit 3/5
MSAKQHRRRHVEDERRSRSLPWTERYRPASLDDIISHREKVLTLKRFVESNELPHLLFQGPPGTGKTSMIQSLANDMYGAENVQRYVLTINGSNERGIGTIRDTVTPFIRVQSDKVKLIVIDEAEALTQDAQGALKSIIETQAKYVRFCLICNDSSRLLRAIYSRCTPFTFTNLCKSSIRERVMAILAHEGVTFTDKAVSTVVEKQRDFRQLINTLQGITAYYRAVESVQDVTVTQENVLQYLGLPSEAKVQATLASLFSKGVATNIALLDELLSNGVLTVSLLVQELVGAVAEYDLLTFEQRLEVVKMLALADSYIADGCSQRVIVLLIVMTFMKVRSARKLEQQQP